MQTLFRSATLTTTHLQFTVRTTSVLELDAYSGAALRGSFFNAIWTRFCTNKVAPTCAQCPLHETCPVSSIVAPLREDSLSGQDIPRPYVIDPPLGGGKYYQPNETFSFGITFLGTIVQLLPYVILSAPQLEADGLGRRLGELKGERGRFHIERIEVYHPFTEQRQTIYEHGSTKVKASVMNTTIEECIQRAEQLNKEQIVLHFRTPMRLVDHEHLVQQASFSPLIQRLLERYLTLEKHYGNPTLKIMKEEKEAFLQQADRIVCSNDQTQWWEMTSFSNRQKRSTPTSGLIGEATFTGDMTPFLVLLVIGELIHVGKNAVKGSGWYHIK